MSGYYFATEQIELRHYREDDWEKLFEEARESEAIRVYEPGIHGVPTEKYYREYVIRAGEEQYRYAVENQAGEFVGTAGIYGVDERNGSFEIVIRIFSGFRNKGYAKAALSLLLKFGFHELRLQKCNSTTIIINTGSIALHKSLGFKEEGIRRRNVYTNGRYFDEILFGMTLAEFEEGERNWKRLYEDER